MKNIFLLLLVTFLAFGAKSQHIKFINSYVSSPDMAEEKDSRKEFYKNGKLKSEESLMYHTQSDYKYDKQWRVTDIDAMYAETGATFEYQYDRGLTVETIFAGNTFSRTITKTDDESKLKSVVIKNIGTDYAQESTNDYVYNHQGLLVKIRTRIDNYFVPEKGYDLLVKKRDKVIENAFLQAIVSSSTEKERLTYNKSGLLTANTKFLNGELIKKTTHNYHEKFNLLLRDSKFGKAELVSYTDYIYDEKLRLIRKDEYQYSEGSFNEYGDNKHKSSKGLVYSYNSDGKLTEIITNFDDGSLIVTAFSNGNMETETHFLKDGNISEKIRFEYIYYTL